MKTQVRYEFDTKLGTKKCCCLTDLNISLEREAKNGYRPTTIRAYRSLPGGEEYEYTRPYPKWMERRYQL